MIIRAHDCPPTPWKNGLGRTREMAVHPPGAGMDDFLWRVSVAEVDSAAPFSAFPGIDRCIVLLDGAGFTMTLDGGRRHALTVPFAPFVFPGEAQVSVTPAGGATRDFNLMLRRGRVRGGVEVWHGAGARTAGPATVLVFAARGTLRVGDDVLHPGDAWRPDGRTPLHLPPDALALAVRAEPVG